MNMQKCNIKVKNVLKTSKKRCNILHNQSQKVLKKGTNFEIKKIKGFIKINEEVQLLFI